jgi:hypothetical protein
VKANPWALLAAAVAIISGVIVLLGYFLSLPILFDLRASLLDWSVILAAIALWVGVIHLARVHWRKVGAGGSTAVYSMVTLLSLALTAGLSLAAGPTSAGSLWIYNHILVPIESGLMAVLAVTLILAFARIFGRRLNLPMLVFALAALFALATAFAWPGMEIFGLSSLRVWIVNVWAMSGARGILLGVALGAIAAGIRVLIGVDRPYSR